MSLKRTLKIFAIIILSSCNDHEQSKIVKQDSVFGITKSMNEPERPMKELEDLALNKGDINAYEELFIAYMDSEDGAFFPFAEQMALKYEYPQAYFDAYMLFLDSIDFYRTTLSSDSCDKERIDKAIRYLKLAYEKGHEQAIDELGNLYMEGKFIKQDTILGKKLLLKYDSIWNSQ